KSNMERFRVACLRAHVRQGRAVRRRVAVLHPAVKGFWGQTANVGGQIWFGSDQPAKMHELVRPHLIGVVAVAGWRFRGSFASPEIRAARALVGRADAVLPVVAIGK